MRAVVQRVSRARVRVAGEAIGSIERGLLVLVGVASGDTESDADWTARKIAALRIFEDAAGKMNLDARQVGGSVLLVSQFTLLGDVRCGNRPGFTAAADPREAVVLFERVCGLVAEHGLPVQRGTFGAQMQVELVNDGPVTILIDSRSGATAG